MCMSQGEGNHTKIELIQASKKKKDIPKNLNIQSKSV